MPAILICGDTLRSPELRHEVPLGIGDPFAAESGQPRGLEPGNLLAEGTHHLG